MADWPKIHEHVFAAGIRCQSPPNVAQTTGGQHAAGSYHYIGCAEDFGTVDSDPIAVAQLFRPIVDSQPHTIAELLCDVDGTNICVLAGRPVPWPSDALRTQHQTHCHVALYPGATVDTPQHAGASTRPEFDPPYVLNDPVVATCKWPGGGILQLGLHGSVYNWEGAPLWGEPIANRYGENWAALAKLGATISPHLDGHGYVIHTQDDGPDSKGYNYREPGF